MIILSALGFFLFIILGYAYPRGMGWGVIFLVPLLGAGQFTLVPAEALPLTTYRIALAVSFGIFMGGKGSLRALKRIFTSKVVKILFLFLLLYGLSASRDRVANTIFTYIPALIFPVLIGAFIVETKRDLELLTKAMVFQSAIVSAFIVIEYFFGFNISVLLKSTNPNIDTASLWLDQVVENYRRSGYYRVSGIDGHPVYTGYRMAFLFPLLLWYYKTKKMSGLVLLSISFLSFLFLQTRTAIITIAVALITLALLSNKKRILPSIGLLIILMLIAFQIPFIKTFITNFWFSSFEQVTEGTDNAFMAQRFYRIPYAFNRFLDSPFLGYGSKEYALYQVMPANDNDLPAPILYTLAGGIFVGIAYTSVLLGMFVGAFRIARSNPPEKEFIYYIAVALLSGCLVLFVNTAENHVISMLMLYTGLYNYNYIKQKALKEEFFEDPHNMQR